MESTDKSQFLESSLRLFYDFILGTIFFGGIAANILVLLIFYRKPGLRTTANRFVTNLMIVNIVACVFLLPIVLIDSNFATTNNLQGSVKQFLSVFCSSVIVYSVLLIAVDQYFAVVDPLHYHCIISSCKGYLMIVATWTFSGALAVFGTIQSDFFSAAGSCEIRLRKTASLRNDSLSDEPRKIEESLETPQNLYRIIFCISYITVAFLIPFGLICFIYYRICAAASGNSKRTRTSILTNEDSNQIKEKLDSTEFEKLTSYLSEKNSVKSENMTKDQLETFCLLRTDNHKCSSKPSFVVTRPSPPKTLASAKIKCDIECECAAKDLKTADGEIKSEKNVAKPKVDPEVPFLKPTLKNNSSFTKLSSLRIQFSNSTENICGSQGNLTERRHSNIPLATGNSEFVNISKTRSSSVQSNFCDVPSCSSSSTRSTTTSNIQSSRSSSLSSTYARHPPSRASSIRSTSSYIVQNIRHRISNASLFKYREEARAARISAMVIVMALFCWFPFFTIFSLHSGICLGGYSSFFIYFDAFSVVFLLLSTVLSPFLFAFRNRQIKKEIRKIFYFFPKKQQKDCRKSFYKHNFSLSLKSQTVHLFAQLNENATAKGNVDPEARC